MKKKIVLILLIVLILVVLALAGGLFYLKQNSTPQKIFTTFVNQAFQIIKEEKANTSKTNIEITASYEPAEDPDNKEQFEEIKKALSNSKINLSNEVDLEKMLIKNNLLVTYDNESFLDAEILMQDEKAYVLLKDWLNKYLQIPSSYINLEDYKNKLNKVKTLDTQLLQETIKNEIDKILSKQKFESKNETININGVQTKVTASSLTLSEKQLTEVFVELLKNLKQNSDFQKALGDFKDEVMDSLGEFDTYQETETQNKTNSINTLSSGMPQTETQTTITIYTKGIMNEFKVINIVTKITDDTTVGISVTRVNDQKYEYNAYIAEKIDLETKKNTTSGSIEIYKNGNSYNGNVMATIEFYGDKINLNYKFNMEKNVQIQKVDVSNAVMADEISEADKQEFIDNFKESKLYDLIAPTLNALFGLGNSNYLDDMYDSKVSNKTYIVNYDKMADMEGITIIENSQDEKMYVTSNGDYIQTSLGGNAEDFLANIDINSVLSTEDKNTNPQAGTINTYPINGIEYKYKTITYEGLNSSVMLYFVCPIDTNNSYVVTVETKGNISLEEVNKFLDVQIEQKNNKSNQTGILDDEKSDITIEAENIANQIESGVLKVNEAFSGLL